MPPRPILYRRTLSIRVTLDDERQLQALSAELRKPVREVVRALIRATSMGSRVASVRGTNAHAPQD